MKTLPVLIVCLMLSGCAAKFNQDMAGPYPENHKEIVAGYMKTIFFDPYSIRDAYITTPHSGSWLWQSGYWVCVSCNAKNRMGGYVGVKTRGYLIAQNTVVTNVEDLPLCSSAPFNDYTPWPEMEGK